MSEKSRTEHHVGRVEIQVLGEFAIWIDGQRQPVPAPRPASLLKVLAIHGGRLTLEQAIDTLWPESDVATGRRRMRNVLGRLRTSLGEIVERHGSSLWLADHVRTDLCRARSAGEHARCPGASLASVTEAVEHHRATLLPDDRYEEWADEARQIREQRLLSLLDRQARLATELAIQSLEDAQDADPFPGDRLRHVQQLRDVLARR